MAHSFDSQIRAIKIAGEEPTDKMKRQIMKKILQSVIAVLLFFVLFHIVLPDIRSIKI